ncbi:MAG: hypothetical protein GX929_08895 [Clostridiales bacterium]|nr:hypothetical protein [Clostridiales bacterium]
MRSPLIYLLERRLVNNVKRFVRSPLRLILSLVVIGMLFFTVFAGNSEEPDASELRDPNELYAIAFVLYSFVFLAIANNGFSKGATMFSMADVNLVFTAPFRRQRVLFYGLTQQLGSSLLVGFFLLFQYTMLHRTYGITYIHLVWLFIGYSLSVFCGQLTAMVVYTLTSSSEQRRRNVKLACYGVLGVIAAAIILSLLGDRATLLPAAVNLAVTTLAWFPVSGWLSHAAAGLCTENFVAVLTGTLGTCAFIGLLTFLVTRSDTDYYEDVLGLTETTHRMKAAAKQGGMSFTSTKLYRRKGSLKKGWGADVLFHKHNLENSREDTLYLSLSMLIFIVVSILFSLIMREAGIAAGFSFAVYMLMFAVSLGRMPKELPRPYIYLIPEPPFKKLFWSIAESLPKLALYSLLCFAPIALICGLSAAETVLCTLAGFSFAYLFLSGFVLVERVFSGLTVRALELVFFFITMVLLAAPGIVLAAIFNTVGVTILSSDATIFLAMLACNSLIATIVLYLCRNMLAYAELNNP